MRQNNILHGSLFAFSVAVAACSSPVSPSSSGDASSSASTPAASADGSTSTAAANAPPSTCFGQPVPPSGLCDAVFLANELVAAGTVAVAKGVAYVTTKDGVATVSADGSINTVISLPMTNALEIVGDELIFSDEKGMYAAPLTDLAATRVVSATEAWAMATNGSNVAFVDGLSPSAVHIANMATKSAPFQVASNATVDGIAIDDDYVYYFADSPSQTADIRRVPVGGGASARVAFVSNACAKLALTKDSVFFMDEWTYDLRVAPKAPGNASRVVFNGVTVIASDNDHIYVGSNDQHGTLTVYRGDSDGSNIVAIGQQTPAAGGYMVSYYNMFVADDALYITSYLEGSLTKLPK